MNIALVGSGKIVQSCLVALSQVPGYIITALCVREQSRTTGEKLCQQFGIDKLYTSYESLLLNTEIDVIYIGLPNHLHFYYVSKALLSGKHVICEKPFTASYPQLIKLATLSRTQNLFLFEAITSIHTPAFKFISKKIHNIGDVKLVQVNYSQRSSRYPDYLSGRAHASLDPSQTGGVLYDINLYNVYILCALLGSAQKISYTCNKGYNGADTSGILTMDYGDFQSVCSGAKDSDSPGHFTVQGTKGYVRIAGAPNICCSAEFCSGDQYLRFEDKTEKSHMVYELVAFHDMVTTNNIQKCNEFLDTAFLVSHTLEKARQYAQLPFPVV